MKDKQKPITWWKDKKLVAGFILVFASIISGFYGKGLVILKFYKPIYLFIGLSLWAFSWILLLLGIFLVGWETVKMIQYKIHHHVKKTVKDTYHYTKKIHKNSIDKVSKIFR